MAFSDSTVTGDRIYGPIISNTGRLKLQKEDDKVTLFTSKVKVEVSFDPVHFAYYDLTTGLKMQEDKGFHQREDVTGLSYLLKDGEAIYGTGSRSIPLNRRGYKFQCFNQANYGYGVGADFLNYSIPAYLSSEKYMVLIDNPARAWFDIGKTDTQVLDFASKGGNTVYYFINGNSYKELMSRYSELTGKQPLPPIWAFGNLTSRFGYHTQEETEYVVDSMISAGFPIDAIIIDLYWFGEELQDGYMGNLSWDTANWPDPDGMIQSFTEKKVKTITISEPFFTRKSKHFNYLSENKLLGLDSAGNTMTMPYFYFGDAGLIDIFKPESRDWWWQQYKTEKERGIAGWWGDLGEPEVHPDDMVHVNGLAQEVHGVYGHEWVAMLYENYQKEYPNERLFKLGRAGYAGSQRYGLIPWSGDVGRDWSGFQAQNNVMLGMSLSGLPYMHSDAGGFAMHPRDSILYLRWCQYALFTPVFRPHGDPNAPSEPIFYHKKVQDILKENIKLRYAMLPYNYTLGWKTEQTGQPMALPLFYEFEDQNISDTLSDQHMWGTSLMVAPVWTKEAETRTVYLPEGDWYDFYDYTAYEGGGYETVTVSDENIPVFARGGSFVPLADVVLHTDDYTGDNLEILCFLDEQKQEFKGEVYFDDGYQKGAFARGEYQLLYLSYAKTENNQSITFTQSGNGYEEAPELRNLTFKVIGIEKEPTEVTGKGVALDFIWENSVLTITGLTTEAAATIVIN